MKKAGPRSSPSSTPTHSESSTELKPTPKHIVTVCSICELPWQNHGEDPTLETCVRLLAAELKKRSTPGWVTPTGYWCYRCSSYVYPGHICYRPWTITYTTNTGQSSQLVNAVSQLKCQLSSSAT